MAPKDFKNYLALQSFGLVWFMVFNTTFNNTSIASFQSFDYVHTSWSLFQKHVMCTGYLHFIKSSYHRKLFKIAQFDCIKNMCNIELYPCVFYGVISLSLIFWKILNPLRCRGGVDDDEQFDWSNYCFLFDYNNKRQLIKRRILKSISIIWKIGSSQETQIIKVNFSMLEQSHPMIIHWIVEVRSHMTLKKKS